MADVLMVPASRTHGRDTEVEHLVGLASLGLEGRGVSLVVEGSPGIGKSALLETALDQLDGHRVLRVNGRRPESGLPLSGLHGLLLPVLHHRGTLPPEHDRLLDDALRRGRYAEDDRLALSVAVLALVTALARGRPLACVVDDAQWVDPDSLSLLSFAAHRLGGVGAAILFASREAAPGELAGLPRLRLAPLPEETLHQVLEETDPDLDPAVRSELARRAHGNPLAARCYAAALSAGQRTGAEPLRRMLPLPAEIMDAHAETLDFLPEDVTRLLLLAALEPGVAVPVLTAERDGAYDPVEALDRAERAGLLRVEAERVEFVDPMMGEVVCRRATSAQLTRAHL